MSRFNRILISHLAILCLVAGAAAQERPSRSEMECLMMAYSNKRVPAGQEAPVPTYEHVWIPGLKYGRFTSNGNELLYRTEGRGNEIVIVVPGGPGLPGDYLRPALSNLGNYVSLVYFDRRADFFSDRNPAQMLSLDELVEDIDALRETLGLARVTLLGNSFGAAVAMSYAMKYPDAVKRLILVGASPSIENPSEVERRIRAAGSPAEVSGGYRETASNGSACDRVRDTYRALYPYYFHRRPDAQSLERGLYVIYFDTLARKLMFSGDAGPSFSARGNLSGIKAPTLLLTGRYDVVTPLDHAATLEKELPRARLVVMEHSGHYPFLEENYMFTQWVRLFIADTSDILDDREARAPIVTSSSRD